MRFSVFIHSLPDLSLNISRSQHIYVNASSCNAFRQRLCHHGYCAFGACICGNVVAGSKGTKAADQNDLSSSTVFLLQHNLNRKLCHTVAMQYIHFLDPDKFVNREIFRCGPVLYTSTRNKHIQNTIQDFHGLCKCAIHLFQLCQVCSYSVCIISLILKAFHGLFQARFIAADQNHFTAILQKSLGNAFSDSSCSSCYNDMFSRYIK